MSTYPWRSHNRTSGVFLYNSVPCCLETRTHHFIYSSWTASMGHRYIQPCMLLKLRFYSFLWVYFHHIWLSFSCVTPTIFPGHSTSSRLHALLLYSNEFSHCYPSVHGYGAVHCNMCVCFLCCFRGIKLSPCVCPRTCVLYLSHSSGPTGVIFGVSKNLVHISLIHTLCWKFSSLNIVFKHSIPNSLRKDTNLYLLVSLMQCLAYCRNLINA